MQRKKLSEEGEQHLKVQLARPVLDMRTTTELSRTSWRKLMFITPTFGCAELHGSIKLSSPRFWQKFGQFGTSPGSGENKCCWQNLGRQIVLTMP